MSSYSYTNCGSNSNSSGNNNNEKNGSSSSGGYSYTSYASSFITTPTKGYNNNTTSSHYDSDNEYDNDNNDENYNSSASAYNYTEVNNRSDDAIGDYHDTFVKLQKQFDKSQDWSEKLCLMVNPNLFFNAQEQPVVKVVVNWESFEECTRDIFENESEKTLRNALTDLTENKIPELLEKLATYLNGSGIPHLKAPEAKKLQQQHELYFAHELHR